METLRLKQLDSFGCPAGTRPQGNILLEERDKIWRASSHLLAIAPFKEANAVINAAYVLVVNPENFYDREELGNAIFRIKKARILAEHPDSIKHIEQIERVFKKLLESL